MELMVRDGDYVSNETGGYRRAEGSDELLQRVLWKLSIPRGSFPFLPELGSRLHLVLRERPSVWQTLCAQYVAEALREEREAAVTSVELKRQGDSARLIIQLEWRGETLTAEMALT